jgi:hypothetical protein
LRPERHNTGRRRGFEPAEPVRAEGHGVPREGNICKLKSEHLSAATTGEEERRKQREHQVCPEFAAPRRQRAGRFEEERGVRDLRRCDPSLPRLHQQGPGLLLRAQTISATGTLKDNKPRVARLST